MALIGLLGDYYIDTSHGWAPIMMKERFIDTKNIHQHIYKANNPQSKITTINL